MTNDQAPMIKQIQYTKLSMLKIKTRSVLVIVVFCKLVLVWSLVLGHHQLRLIF